VEDSSRVRMILYMIVLNTIMICNGNALIPAFKNRINIQYMRDTKIWSERSQPIECLHEATYSVFVMSPLVSYVVKDDYLLKSVNQLSRYLNAM